MAWHAPGSDTVRPLPPEESWWCGRSLWDTVSQAVCCAVSWELYPQIAVLQSNPTAGPWFEVFWHFSVSRFSPEL